MTRRDYTDDDYGTCRYIEENATSGVWTPINEVGASLTIARVKRLKRLNLVDGIENATSDGDLVRLAGLGRKSAAEAVRLGIDSV